MLVLTNPPHVTRLNALRLTICQWQTENVDYEIRSPAAIDVGCITRPFVFQLYSFRS